MRKRSPSVSTQGPWVVGHQVLLAVPTEIAGVLVVHLRTHHQPQVGGKHGGVEFYKSVGIAVTHPVAVAGFPGVVAAYLGKQDGIIFEAVGVRQHKADIAVIVRMGLEQFGVENLLFVVVVTNWS